MTNGVHDVKIERVEEDIGEIKNEVNALTKTVTDVQMEVVRHTEQIKSVCKKVDTVQEGINDIKDALVGDTKAQNSQLKKWLSRAVVIILGSGATAGGVQALMSMLN